MIFDASEHIEVLETQMSGKSLFAKHDFKKDEVIFVVYGKIIPYATDYAIPINDSLFIEPRDPGSHGQYMNHSCDPNMGVKNRSIFVAMRDIKAGEEVTTNYAFLGYEYGHEMSLAGTEKKIVDLTCNCQAKECTGRLACYKEMPPEWRERCQEYISDYLLDENKYPYIPFQDK